MTSKIIITEECINCGACLVECPADAIFEPGESFALGDNNFAPLSNEHYFIAPDLCNTCAELNEKKCIAVCPMNAIEEN